MKNFKALGVMVLIAACISGCFGHKKAAGAGAGASAGKKGDSSANAVPGAATDVQEASLRAHVYENDPNLQIIHFALDSTEFSDEALSLMKANVAYLKTKESDAVLIEGYADDRGTIEYNLALGQRRAEAIKEYYHSLGIPIGHMATISYGKMKPVCSQDDNTCWGQNRRGETKLGTPTE